jgi:putative peptidoglycan lipid II flippase
MAPAAVALFVLGPPLAELLFGFGNAPAESARFIGTILAAFVLGMPAFTVFYVLLRGFYAVEDTRTPALINLGMTAINVAAAVGLYVVATDVLKVPALALGFSLSYLLATPVMWTVLRRRLGGLPTAWVVRTTTRVLLAALISGVVMLLVTLGLEQILSQGRVASLVEVVLAGGLGAAVYLALARWMRITEVGDVVDTVVRRLRRS